MNRLAIVFSLALVPAPLSSQGAKPGDSMSDCPMHKQHAQQAHHVIVENNGDKAMGFPHDKTTHHFRLVFDGGAAEVTVDDPSDRTNTDAIRAHLSHIATMFGNGDFSAPMFIHDGVPPGTTTMKLMKSAIHYTYEEIPLGARVRMTSDDPVAIASIHDFMRFQITEHQTGDALEVAQK